MKNSQYGHMVSLYEKIFPLSTQKLDGITDFIGPAPQTILDIGCATGELSYQLACLGHFVHGIDLDENMLKFAKQHKKHPDLSFQVMDMTRVKKYFEAESINKVICLGNTLVHLNSVFSVTKMLEEIYSILKPGGKLLIQILNYHRILSDNITELPLIENDFLRFERSYKFSPDSKSLNFHTRLTGKTDKVVSEGELTLLPLKPDELQEALKKSGFRNIELWESYQKNPFHQNSSYPLIASAKKQS